MFGVLEVDSFYNTLMSKKFWLATVAVIMAFLAGGPVVAATPDDQVIFVDSSAVAPGDGTLDRPFVDFTQALSKFAEPGNTATEVRATGVFDPVVLDPDKHSGTPEQYLLITEWHGRGSLSFASDGSGRSLMDTHGASYVIIDGVIASGGHGEFASGILVSNSHDVFIRNCTCDNNEEAGITVAGSTNVSLENNRVRDNLGNGFEVTRSHGTIVRGNVVDNNGTREHGYGAMITDSDGTQLSRNVITQNHGNGVWLSGSKDLLLERNDIANNGGDGFEFGDAHDVLLTWNRIVRNAGDGVDGAIRTTTFAGLQFKNNVIAQNGGRGVTIDTGVPVVFDGFNNTLLSNGQEAFYFMDRGSNVRLYNNVIAHHSIGMRLETPNNKRILSDYNNSFDNDEDVVVIEGPRMLHWDDWRAEGHDLRTRRVDPKFDERETCIGVTCVAYHLKKTSPLINAGWSGLLLPPTDIDGDDRLWRGVDIGADEYSPVANRFVK